MESDRRRLRTSGDESSSVKSSVTAAGLNHGKLLTSGNELGCVKSRVDRQNLKHPSPNKNIVGFCRSIPRDNVMVSKLKLSRSNAESPKRAKENTENVDPSWARLRRNAETSSCKESDNNRTDSVLVKL